MVTDRKKTSGIIIKGSNLAVDYWELQYPQRNKIKNELIRFMTRIDNGQEREVYLYSKTGGKIHTSEFNKWYLIKYWNIDADLVIGLKTDEVLSVEAYDGTVSVVAQDAGYIPGAIMLYFDGPFGTVLYTGYFRLNFQIFASHTTGKIIAEKGLDVLYADNSHVAKHCNFPSRTEIKKEVLSLIKQNLVPEKKVLIYSKSELGNEGLLCSISKDLEIKIQASQRRMEILDALNVSRYFSTSPQRIINIDEKPSLINCAKRAKKENANLVVIVTERYHCDKFNLLKDKPNLKKLPEGTHIIPSSNHCNHLEFVNFVRGVNPRKLVFLVDGDDASAEGINATFDDDYHALTKNTRIEEILSPAMESIYKKEKLDSNVESKMSDSPPKFYSTRNRIRNSIKDKVAPSVRPELRYNSRIRSINTRSGNIFNGNRESSDSDLSDIVPSCSSPKKRSKSLVVSNSNSSNIVAPAVEDASPRSKSSPNKIAAGRRQPVRSPKKRTNSSMISNSSSKMNKLELDIIEILDDKTPKLKLLSDEIGSQRSNLDSEEYFTPPEFFPVVDSIAEVNNKNKEYDQIKEYNENAEYDKNKEFDRNEEYDEVERKLTEMYADVNCGKLVDIRENADRFSESDFDDNYEISPIMFPTAKSHYEKFVSPSRKNTFTPRDLENLRAGELVELKSSEVEDETYSEVRVVLERVDLLRFLRRREIECGRKSCESSSNIDFRKRVNLGNPSLRMRVTSPHITKIYFPSSFYEQLYSNRKHYAFSHELTFNSVIVDNPIVLKIPSHLLTNLSHGKINRNTRVCIPKEVKRRIMDAEVNASKERIAVNNKDTLSDMKNVAISSKKVSSKVIATPENLPSRRIVRKNPKIKRLNASYVLSRKKLNGSFGKLKNNSYFGSKNTSILKTNALIDIVRNVAKRSPIFRQELVKIVENSSANCKRRWTEKSANSKKRCLENSRISNASPLKKRFRCQNYDQFKMLNESALKNLGLEKFNSEISKYTTNVVTERKGNKIQQRDEKSVTQKGRSEEPEHLFKRGKECIETVKTGFNTIEESRLNRYEMQSQNEKEKKLSDIMKKDNGKPEKINGGKVTTLGKKSNEKQREETEETKKAQRIIKNEDESQRQQSNESNAGKNVSAPSFSDVSSTCAQPLLKPSKLFPSIIRDKSRDGEFLLSKGNEEKETFKSRKMNYLLQYLKNNEQQSNTGHAPLSSTNTSPTCSNTRSNPTGVNASNIFRVDGLRSLFATSAFTDTSADKIEKSAFKYPKSNGFKEFLRNSGESAFKPQNYKDLALNSAFKSLSYNDSKKVSNEPSSKLKPVVSTEYTEHFDVPYYKTPENGSPSILDTLDNVEDFHTPLKKLSPDSSSVKNNPLIEDKGEGCENYHIPFLVTPSKKIDPNIRREENASGGVLLNIKIVTPVRNARDQYCAKNVFDDDESHFLGNATVQKTVTENNGIFPSIQIIQSTPSRSASMKESPFRGRAISNRIETSVTFSFLEPKTISYETVSGDAPTPVKNKVKIIKPLWTPTALMSDEERKQFYFHLYKFCNSRRKPAA